MKLIQNITLDFCKNEYKTVTLKQYDKNSRHLKITCTENGVKYNLDSSLHKCSLKMITPNQRIIYNESDTVTINDDGTVLVVFSENMLSCGGLAKLEIIFTDKNTNATLSTMILNVNIIKSVYDENAIVSTNEFSKLTKALEDVETAITTVEDIDEEEKLRVEAERNRAVSEQDRLSSEHTRKQNEEKRKENETKRQSNETDRQTTLSKLKNAIQQCENASNENALSAAKSAQEAKKSYEETKKISSSISGVLKPCGTVTFEQLPKISNALEGELYNISNDFTTTTDFKEGAGIFINKGTNVFKTSDNKWDILSGVFCPLKLRTEDDEDLIYMEYDNYTYYSKPYEIIMRDNAPRNDATTPFYANYGLNYMQLNTKTVDSIDGLYTRIMPGKIDLTSNGLNPNGVISSSNIEVSNIAGIENGSINLYNTLLFGGSRIDQTGAFYINHNGCVGQLSELLKQCIFIESFDENTGTLTTVSGSKKFTNG